jgi:hypothetical protein
MKLISLFATAAFLSSPAFADDLCATQLQQLDDSKAQITTLGSPVKEQVEELTLQAKQAQNQGDLETCSSHGAKALQALDAPKADGQNG